MARWADALDAQMEVVTGLLTNERTRRGMIAWMEAERKKNRLPVNDYAVQTMADRVATMAFNADPVYVEPEMQDLWEASLEGFEPEPLMEQDLITPAGFMFLPRPYRSRDVNGKIITTRAIMWHPQAISYEMKAVQQALAEMHPDGNVPEPVTLQAHGLTIPISKRTEQSFSGEGIMFTSFHLTSDKDEWTQPNEPPGLHVQFIFPWVYGTVFPAAMNAVIKDREIDSCQSWQAMWRLMQQTITSVTRERPDRSTRKRLERVKWPEKNVTVIRLRRHAPDRETNHEPEVVNWTHRWLVGAYWRRQWYGSGESKFSRQILVSGHVKGPDDLPLVARKARIFELVR